jgi:hypothetical protein
MTIDDLEKISLTGGQAYRAMACFLQTFFDRTDGQGALRTLLGDIELERDGRSTDPAALADWSRCLRASLMGEDDSD